MICDAVAFVPKKHTSKFTPHTKCVWQTKTNSHLQFSHTLQSRHSICSVQYARRIVEIILIEYTEIYSTFCIQYESGSCLIYENWMRVTQIYGIEIFLNNTKYVLISRQRLHTAANFICCADSSENCILQTQWGMRQCDWHFSLNLIRAKVFTSRLNCIVIYKCLKWIYFQFLLFLFCINSQIWQIVTTRARFISLLYIFCSS